MTEIIFNLTFDVKNNKQLICFHDIEESGVIKNIFIKKITINNQTFLVSKIYSRFKESEAVIFNNFTEHGIKGMEDIPLILTARFFNKKNQKRFMFSISKTNPSLLSHINKIKIECETIIGLF